MKNKKKWLIAACVTCILAISAAGTIAYLTDTTEEVVNTFTVGKLLDSSDKFVLLEHEATDSDKDGVYTLNNSEVDGNSYTILPGVDLPKDPFVKTSKPLEMDAYVFVEVVDTTGTAISFTVDSSKWTVLTGVTGRHGGEVYALKDDGGIAQAGEALGPVPILAEDTNGNEITVSNTSFTDDSDAEAKFGGDLKFYGYMIQAGSFTSAADAWTKGFGGTN